MSMVFSCAATIAHGNYFFHLHQQSKSSATEVNFSQVSILKKILSGAKLLMLIKQKSLSLPRNVSSHNFWGVAI